MKCRKRSSLQGWLPNILCALLGFSQRQIKAKRAPDTGSIRTRKPITEVQKSLGEWIRFWRMDKGMTQKQLAALAQLPMRRLHIIEAAAVLPSRDEMAAIECALGIEVDSNTCGPTIG